MKTFTFFCFLIFTFSAFSQKQLDSIRRFTADQGVFTNDFTRIYYEYSPDSVIESEDNYLANFKIYNKNILRLGKYDTNCKQKFSSYTLNEFDQFSQKYKITTRFSYKYDSNCNMSQFIYYDYKKMDTFIISYFDLYDDKGNFGSEINYYNFDGNGLTKAIDGQATYIYNSQNKLIESTLKNNVNGIYVTTGKRRFEYNNEGKETKYQFITIDTSGNETVINENLTSYFNGGFVTVFSYIDYNTTNLYEGIIDTSFLDKDDDVTYRHIINKNVKGEVISNNKHYYYYSGSSATTANSLDPDISINNFICVEGVMYFSIDNPKGKKLDISVSDINGRLIYKNTANESKWHSPQISTNAGMYILKVETKDGVKVQKKIAN
jgi:Secretion system C-terminal sorting domain